MKVVLICESCEKETLSSDLSGLFVLNFKKKTIEFQCSLCNKINVFDWNVISNNRILPKTKVSKF